MTPDNIDNDPANNREKWAESNRQRMTTPALQPQQLIGNWKDEHPTAKMFIIYDFEWGHCEDCAKDCSEFETHLDKTIRSREVMRSPTPQTADDKCCYDGTKCINGKSDACNICYIPLQKGEKISCKLHTICRYCVNDCFTYNPDYKCDHDTRATHTSPPAPAQDERKNNCCEWCGSEYPCGTWEFYHAVVFGKDHTICIDCFNHLENPDSSHPHPAPDTKYYFDEGYRKGAKAAREKAETTDNILAVLKKRYRKEMAIIDYIEMIECEIESLRARQGQP